MSRGWTHLLEKTLSIVDNDSSAIEDLANYVGNANVGSGLEAAINTAANGTYSINPSALTASKLEAATDTAASGTYSTDPSALTASKFEAAIDTAASGTYSTDPSALTDGKIESFLTAIDPNGASTRASGTTSNAASPDTSNTLTPSLSVDAADPANVTFTVSGLESDYSGGVTFTDSTGKSDVVPISGNGNYSANLSNLTDGTLTYLMTVSNPAGNVINVDPTTTLGDGSANAPAGAPQFPDLLNGYAVRPSWMVAGVDYAVGVPAGTALKDPTTLIGMSGVSVNTSGHSVTVTANNVAISNIDFSLDGGWQLIIDGGNNDTVTNCNFAIGSNHNPMFNQYLGNNTIFTYCTFNGNGTADSLNNTVFNLNGGMTLEYSLVENSPSDDIDYGYSNTAKYNVFYNDGELPGAHPDWLQLGNGTLTNQTMEFNTFIQNGPPSQGIGLYAGTPGTYTLVNADISNNTIVTLPGAQGAQVNYVFCTVLDGSKPGGGTGSLTGTALIQNNYIDPSGVNTAVFETVGTLQPGASYIQSNNINMVTGALLPQNVTSVTNVVASPASGVEFPGNTITLTLEMSGAASVIGAPTLSLNDGGTATYTGGSGSDALTFSYTVGANDTPVSALAIAQVNLPNGATITDGSGDAVVLTDALVTFPGLQIDPPSGPTLSSIVESPSSADLNAGKTVTLTLNLIEAVTVAGGTPTLTLNDGGTATYTGGSGTNGLTFSYTVGAGQNTPALAATAINLNSAAITDGAGNAANLSLSGLTQSGPQIDTTTPTVSSLVESPASGDLNAGKTVTFTLNLNEAMTVASGTPTLTLNDGGTATYTGGSGTNALTFSYTVGAGQNTSALAATAVNLNSASISDGAGNAANLSLSGLTQSGPQIDTITPTISSLVASPASGDLNGGKTITFTLNLNETVTVAGGTPTLTLNDGGTAIYTGGSGTNALSFSYTVGAGQNAAALAATAINLNSATVKDGAGNAANLSLTGLTQSGPQVDTVTPTITSLGESPANGDLNAGKTVTFTLNLNEAVTVAGSTPTLTLNDGGTATYTGGSGSNALTFSYTVSAGQNTAALAATAVNLNSATITDGAGNAANLSLSGLTQNGPQIDTLTPTISSLTESPSSGDLNAGKVVTITVGMSEVVTVNTTGGTPTLSLNDGGTATYSGGSGTNALTFSYTVGAGQNTAALAATAVNLNSATVKDGAGNAASLSLTGLSQSGPKIDTGTPTMLSLTESPASGDLKAGNTVTLTLNLNEAVTVTGGTPTLTLNDGGTATYSGGSGSNALTFSYTVGAGQNTAALAATAINLNSATVKDGAGNAASLSLTGLTQSGPQIDTVTPTMSSLVESPASGDLNAGNTVTLTLNLNTAVTVAGGTPTLTLNDGGTATYSGGSGTNALTFSYTVGAGQNTAALAATAVNLNSASITDGAGNAANLALSSLTQSGPQIDTLTPTVSSLTESPAGGNLNAGKTVTLTLNLSEAVTVAGGTPTLILNDGGTATYSGGSGTNALTFSYTVGAGQNTAALAATAVNLNSASITDGAGNAANLSLSGLTQSGPQIDAITPSISSLVESPSSGDLNAGKTVTFTLNLNEAVTAAGGTPTLTLNDGGTATYSGGSGTNALTFSYTVGAGQNIAALAATAVNLNSASITDGAGNAANLSLSGLTQSGPQIDAITPSISSLVESPSSGDLNAGKTVTFTLNLNEAVTAAGGTPTLTLNDGGTATYSGGSGTNALTFSYTVGAGQNTSALAATAVNLNSASITDGAGNAANLSLSGLTQSGPQIDTLTPTISSLAESPATGDLNAGKTVTFTLNLNEAVTVAGGAPTLSLNDGGTATYSGGSGTNALTFSYTVLQGQNTPDLMETAVNLNGATIADGAGNIANLSLIGVPEGSPQIDTTTPTIASLTESPAGGDLNAGKTVTLTLNVSEVVTVAGGTPTLTLNDGGTATYSGGSGTNALTFSYTVGAGQNTAALAAAAVNLNSATITDGAGNAANLALSGLTQSGPQIDTITPTIASLMESPASADLNAGKTVTFTLNLNEAVAVASGTPTLTLNDGGTATYTGGSGISALTFSYTVGAGQNTSALAATTVNLNSATITDGVGNAANLALSGLTQSGPQIDTTTPTITSLVESPASGELNTGNTVTLTLNLSEAVTVAGGTPTLTLNNGGTATYTGGSGTNALSFSYTVGDSQSTFALAATAVNLNSASITDGAGNAANLSLSGLTQSGPQIDALSLNALTPTVSSLVESPASGDLNAGKIVTLTLNLSEAVTVAGGMPALTLNDGGTAVYTGGSGTNALTFSYTVGAGQNTAALAATAINLNSATVKDGAGNAASLSLTGLTQSGPQIDTGTPTMSSLTESPASGDLKAGNTVTLTLNLNAAVTVAGGTPTLTLNDGGTATYTGGSASNALTFSYTVGAGQNTAALAATAVNLNSAAITDGAGNAANLSLTGLTQGGPQIDTVTPTISSLVESPASGDLNAGNTATLTLNLSEAVTVAGGTPTLTLNDGGTATYVSGSGTNALTFSYTVGAGQNTSGLAATAVNLNSATVKDGAGNAANLSLNGLTQSGPQIDTVTPTISSLVESPASGDLNAGNTATLTLNLSEAVTVAGGTPTLTLNDGGTATYTGGSGTNALTFSYTVGAGQNTAALAATAVNLNSAAITDGAGNAADLTGLIQSGPQIDTTTPTISSIAESPASGDLNASKVVTVTLDMSEVVTVNTTGGTPTLTLNDGGTATYTGGSGTNALSFSYTVGAGQNTAALAAAAVNLNSAAITDGAGNAANLSLNGLTQSGPQIDTVTPTISSLVESPASGDLNAGNTATLTLNLNEAVTVAGGTPTLTLNDGGTATYAGGSGTNALTFSYTVGAGQNTAALAATAVNLNSAAITDGAGNAANLSLTGLTQGGPQIDTVTPTISSLVESPASGDLNAGNTVTLTLNLSEAVTVAGGTPTLTLNDGGTASYVSGSGTNALTFSYTVGAGQNTSGLAATAINLNSATVKDSAGNAANLSLNGLTQSGPQIDTVTPTISSLVESPASGDLNAGKVVTVTLDMSEVVTVNTTGGAPTLTLNDGGTATYVSGSGTNALTFSYTVAAGQNTPDLMETAVNLNGATIEDGAGNAANLSLVGLPQGSPQIDTTPPPTPTIISDKVIGKRVVLSGTEAEKGTAISIYDGTTLLGTTTTGRNGAWVFTTGPLANGTHAFAATATDPAGNISAPSSSYDPNIGAGPTIAAAPIQVGNQFYVYNSSGSGLALSYAGTIVTGGEFGSWTPIAATLTTDGFEVAWKNTGTGQYTVWTTDSNGKYTGNLIGAVSRNNYALESLEPVFNQDLNGDGLIGPPTKIIRTDTNSFGSTSLTEVANLYFYLDGSGSSGPALKYNNANVTAGQFGNWKPIGAVQTASGLEVAWKNTGTGQYTVWTTDSNGNYTGNLIGAVAGNSYALKSLEPVFQQDLNGDGAVGLTQTVIATDGSTSLTEVGSLYYYLDGSSGSGPALKYKNADVTAGEFGGWTPIGVLKTASGYDVAWKVAGVNEYTVWTTDSNGNYIRNIGAVSGTSAALESFEPIFGQDLNGDGVIGLTKVIKTDGATSLTEVANRYYYLDGSSGSGPALKYHGADVTAGEFGGWTPIGAVKTASGYDVAWKVVGVNEYTVWITDSNGNYIRNIGAVSGTSAALGSFEPIFGQDLNGDGMIGLYAAPGTMLKISQSLTGSSAATTIGAGATLEISAADSSSVTFVSSTGMLKLDQPSTFSGEIFGLTGNGSLSGSDQIDLRGINYNTVQDSYANGVLTITDGTDTAHLDFSGSYSLGNFKFASDGDGGTIVYDPPVTSSQSATGSGSITTRATIGDDETSSALTEQALNFRGTISGFEGKNVMDLPSIAFDAQSTLGYLPSSNLTGGSPSLGEGINSANIALLGNYMASSFATSSDNQGCTMVIAEAVQASHQMVLSNTHHA